MRYSWESGLLGPGCELRGHTYIHTLQAYQQLYLYFLRWSVLVRLNSTEARTHGCNDGPAPSFERYITTIGGWARVVDGHSPKSNTTALQPFTCPAANGTTHLHSGCQWGCVASARCRRSRRHRKLQPARVEAAEHAVEAAPLQHARSLSRQCLLLHRRTRTRHRDQAISPNCRWRPRARASAPSLHSSESCCGGLHGRASAGSAVPFGSLLEQNQFVLPRTHADREAHFDETRSPKKGTGGAFFCMGPIRVVSSETTLHNDVATEVGSRRLSGGERGCLELMGEVSIKEGEATNTSCSRISRSSTARR